MTERERLIELLASPTPIVEGGSTVGEKRLSYFLAENIADKLLANGVIVLPELPVIHGDTGFTTKEAAEAAIAERSNHEQIQM